MHRYQMQFLLCFNKPNFETYNFIKKMKKQTRKKKSTKFYYSLLKISSVQYDYVDIKMFNLKM